MEVFHSLADGYGGLTLLYMLMSKYFHYKYPDIVPELTQFPGVDDVPFEIQMADNKDTVKRILYYSKRIKRFI